MSAWDDYTFTYGGKDYYLITESYPVDGVRVSLSQWSNFYNEYITLYDRRVIDDTYWLCVATVVGETLDVSYEELEGWLSEQTGIEVYYGEDDIEECDTNHEWIGEPLYCSACGVDKGNERNTNA